MRYFLFAIIMALGLVACEKSASDDQVLSGRYLGIFSRTGMDTSQVSLFFDLNHFEGFSSNNYYPAICAGNFELSAGQISFADTCAWTANFDWSLILSGDYNIQFTDGIVRIWKTSGGITDEYLLRQPTR